MSSTIITMEDNRIEQQDVAVEQDGDCRGQLLAGFVFVWITAVCLLTAVGGWLAEQIVIASGFQWPTYAWPLISLGQALAILLPTLALSRWSGLRYRVLFQTWAAAGLFALLLTLVRLAPLTAAQLAAGLQIIAGLVFIGLLQLWSQRQRRHEPDLNRQPLRATPAAGLALLLAAFLGYSWLAWGALGSVLDTLLNLAAGLLLGVAAALLLRNFLLRPLRQTSGGLNWDITVGGLAAGTALLILATSFGANGQQLLLLLVLPALGWLVVGLGFVGIAQGTTAVNGRAMALLIGLAAALPMALIDPDELILVLNTGVDILLWALAAAAVSMLVGWLAGLLLFFLHGRLPEWRSVQPVTIAAALAWTAGLAVYFLAGQPGLHGERLFVILNDQADATAAAAIDDYDVRRRFVYDSLVEQAQSSQVDLRRSLDRLGIDYQPYYLVNALEVEGGPLLRLWLSQQPAVDRVLDSPILRPLPQEPPEISGSAGPPAQPQWNLTSIGADRVWSELGVRGAGIIIGQSDSGVQGDHPELQDGYRGRGGDHDYNWFDPWYGTAVPTDWGGHGTHTLGSILGNMTGVAPDAEWLGCVNLARNLGNPALYLDCMQFMLAPFPQDGDPFTDGDPSRAAHILNNSWGCPDIEGCDAATFEQAVGALRAAGIFTVVSAGNSGFAGCGTVDSPPAIYDAVFSVGAVNRNADLAEFSSLGPVEVDGSLRRKPDLVAPGVAILSAFPNSSYTELDGTSMAGPHVAGVVALLWSANPDLIGDIGRTEAILRDTARPYAGRLPACVARELPNNAVGYGLVDAFAAVQMALGDGR